jgi:peptidoglycan/xylan/chitin deacetylase (PgdA/CDA1 family)
VEDITGQLADSQKKEGHQNLENGCVSMSFDDGYQAVFFHALPMFKKYGMVGTAYITTGVTGREGYLSWKQLHDLEGQGWEIGAHTDTHPDFEKISLKDAKQEAFTSKKKLEEHGLKATAFAFPFGSYTQADLAALSTKFNELRAFQDTDELNDPVGMNTDLIKVKGVAKDTPISEIKSWLEEAKQKKRCLALVFHDLSAKEAYTGTIHHIREPQSEIPEDYGYTYDLGTLKKVIDAVKDSGLPVVTESQMTKIPGAPILTGTLGTKNASWSLNSEALIDHNMHGSYPNPRDSYYRRAYSTTTILSFKIQKEL